jgi:LAO/AO transport system kinase
MRAEAQITSSLRLLGISGNPHDPHSEAYWHPKVLKTSALQGQGLDAFWEAVTTFRRLQTANGLLANRRQHQALAWMWERIDAGLKQSFKNNPLVRAQLPAITSAVQSGQLAASTAARQLLVALASSATATPLKQRI